MIHLAAWYNLGAFRSLMHDALQTCEQYMSGTGGHLKGLAWVIGSISEPPDSLTSYTNMFSHLDVPPMKGLRAWPVWMKK